MRSVALLLLVLLPGCGARPPEKIFAVQGTLTVDGQPAANASVAFHPAAPANNRLVCPVAITNRDGSYQLSTAARGEGAPAGEYIVTVIWPNPDEPFDECECLDFKRHDLFRGQYADPKTSTLRAFVQPQRNVIALQVAAMPSDEE